MGKQIILPQPVMRFMAQFGENGYEVYAVGGAVRDLLLGRNTNNWDFATNATPEKIQTIFPDSFYHNRFGTVSVPEVIGKSKVIFEITPYRRESDYSDNRHPDQIDWAKTIEEDLARRDFTINSMAFDGTTLEDNHGGETDLTNKIIKAVGDPTIRFKEDALRMMRAVRLATTLGFTIEKSTAEAIKKNAPLLQNISWERIADELLKIMESDDPAGGVGIMKEVGILALVLPELEACFGVEQQSPGRHHIYDVGTHLLESLRHCPSKDPITRLATLLHDIGKAETQATAEGGTITFYNHEIVGAAQVEVIATRLRLSKEQKNKLVTMVRHHMFSVSEEQSDKAVRRFIRSVGPELVPEMLALREGDRLGSGAKRTSWRTEDYKKRLIEVQQAPFSIRDLKINGEDVMRELNLKPGPKVGKILSTIFEQVDDGKIPNEREELLREIHLI